VILVYCKNVIKKILFVLVKIKKKDIIIKILKYHCLIK